MLLNDGDILYVCYGLLVVFGSNHVLLFGNNFCYVLCVHLTHIRNSSSSWPLSTYINIIGLFTMSCL